MSCKEVLLPKECHSRKAGLCPCHKVVDCRKACRRACLKAYPRASRKAVAHKAVSPPSVSRNPVDSPRPTSAKIRSSPATTSSRRPICCCRRIRRTKVTARSCLRRRAEPCRSIEDPRCRPPPFLSIVGGRVSSPPSLVIPSGFAARERREKKQKNLPGNE